MVRVCPDCGEEFRPEIVRCSDCGAMLIDRWEEEDGAAGEGEPERRAPEILPNVRIPADYAPVATAPSAAEIEPLAHRLGAAGIAFAVNGSVQQFTLLVPEQELERALSVLGAGDAPAEEAGAPCPACGADVGGASECPECGLALKSDPDGLARDQRDRGPDE